MKQLLIFAFFVLTTAQAFAGNIAHEGGISGGGGDTIEPHPVGMYSIESILQSARFQAFMFLNTRLAQIHLSKIAHPNGNSAPELIQTVKIFVNSTGPCRDAGGNAVDGSIYSPQPNTICISSFTLGTKLNEDSAFSQTLALVVHEYTHLVGASEDEADRIQEVARREFHRSPKYRMELELSSRFADAWHDFVGKIPKLKESEAKNTKSYMEKMVAFVNISNASEAYNDLLLQYDSMMTPAQQVKAKVLAAKWDIISIGVKLFIWGADYETTEKDDYEKGFGDRKEVKVSDFERTQIFSFYGDRLPATDVMVLKIENDQDIAPAVNSLFAEWKALYQEICASQQAAMF